MTSGLRTLPRSENFLSSRRRLKAAVMSSMLDLSSRLTARTRAKREQKRVRIAGRIFARLVQMSFKSGSADGMSLWPKKYDKMALKAKAYIQFFASSLELRF